MADRELKVRITGDTSSLDKALGRSSKATDKWGARVQRAGRAAGFAGLAIGGALVVGLTKATKGALEDEAAMARLTQAFKQSNVPIQDYRKSIDEAEAAGVKLGFTDDSVVESLGSLVIATHDGKKAIDLLSTAEDIARFKHLDLAGASKILTMAMAGSQRATKQLGLSLQPTTENVDALKAAAEENKTKVDSMALAQAKAADKMQTAQNVIALVTQKLKGQSQAFSETAAGGVERMRASLDRLSDTIGAALLPALNKVIQPLSQFFTYLADNPQLAEKLVIGIAALAVALLALSVAASAAASIGVLASVFAVVLSPIGLVVIALGALVAAIAVAVLWPDKLQKSLEMMGLSAKQSKEMVDSLRNAFTAIKTVVDRVWPSIEATIVPALRVIQGILMVVSALLRGDFSEAWKGVKIVVANEMKFMLAIVTAMPRIIGQAALAIGKAAIDGIKSGAASAWPAVAAFFKSLPAKILGYFAGAAKWLYNIGGEIINGLASGIRDAAAGVLQSAISYVTGLIPDVIKSHLGIGSPSKVTIEIGKQIAEGLGVGFGLGMVKVRDEFGTKIQSAIDHMIAAVQAKQGAFGSAFDALVSSALEAFDTLSERMMTKTEKLIARQDKNRARNERQAALTAATTHVAGAHAALEGAATPEDQQAALADLEIALKEQKDAEFAITRAANEEKAAQEREALDNRRGLRRKHFADSLTDLQNALLSQEITADQFNERMLKLFKKFQVPLGKASKGLGLALAEGMNEGMSEVQKAARLLAETIARELRKLRITVNVELVNDSGQGGGNPAQRALGGRFRPGQRLIVGERGPELVTFGNGGMVTPNNALGGGMIENHIAVYLDGKQIHESVQRQEARYKNNNGRSAFA